MSKVTMETQSEVREEDTLSTATSFPVTGSHTQLMSDSKIVSVDSLLGRYGPHEKRTIDAKRKHDTSSAAEREPVVGPPNYETGRENKDSATSDESACRTSNYLRPKSEQNSDTDSENISLDSDSDSGSDISNTKDTCANQIGRHSDVMSEDINHNPALTRAMNESVDDVMKFAEILYKCTLCTSLPSILTSRRSFIHHVTEQHLTHQSCFRECQHCSLRLRTQEDLNSHVLCAHPEINVSLVTPSSSRHVRDKGSPEIPASDATSQISPRATKVTVDHPDTKLFNKRVGDLQQGCKRTAAESHLKASPEDVLLDLSKKERRSSPTDTTWLKRNDNKTVLTNAHGKPSYENMSRIQQLTDQIVKCNSPAAFQAKAALNVNVLRFTPSFTAEFGKYTKLVREGGNIVYFCQVCNWKSPVKSTFQVHCNLSSHKSKVSSAEHEGDGEVEAAGRGFPSTIAAAVYTGTKAPNVCVDTERRDFREPVSWSPRGGASCLSMLAESQGLYMGNGLGQARQDVGGSDRAGRDIVLPFQSGDVKAQRSSVMSASAPSDSGQLKKKGQTSADGRSNRRKRSAPTYLRNQSLFKRHWSESDSDSDSDREGNYPDSPLNSAHCASSKKQVIAHDPVRSLSKGYNSFKGDNAGPCSPNKDHDGESKSRLTTEIAERLAGDGGVKSSVNITSHSNNRHNIAALLSAKLPRSPTSPLSRFPPHGVDIEQNRGPVTVAHKPSQEQAESQKATSPKQDVPAAKHTSSSNAFQHSRCIVGDFKGDKQDEPFGDFPDRKQTEVIEGVVSRGRASIDVLGDLEAVKRPGSLGTVGAMSYRCYICSYEYTDIANYQRHFETAHCDSPGRDRERESPTEKGGATDASYSPVEMGENWRVQKLKDVLPDFLVLSGKGNISREHLLQRVSLAVGSPDVVTWGSACNKAMREVFPSSLAQRKGKYKNYFFGVNIIEPPMEQDDALLSDVEAMAYQPLRDMNIDMEKLLEHLPASLYWTGDLERGVSRDEVLTLLGETIEDGDVRQWGTQCNKAIRMIFPRVEMKRKGKYKTVFFGVDFRDNYQKQTFVPSKRGRPRKPQTEDGEVIGRQDGGGGYSLHPFGEDPRDLIRKARAKHWLDSIGSLSHLDIGGSLSEVGGHATDFNSGGRDPAFMTSLMKTSLSLSPRRYPTPIPMWYSSSDGRVPSSGIDWYTNSFHQKHGYQYTDDNEDGDDEDDTVKGNRGTGILDCSVRKENGGRESPGSDSGSTDRDPDTNKEFTNIPVSEEAKEIAAVKNCKDAEKGKLTDRNEDVFGPRKQCLNCDEKPRNMSLTDSEKRQHMHDIVSSLKDDVT